MSSIIDCTDALADVVRRYGHVRDIDVSATREGYVGAAEMDDEMLWAQMIGGDGAHCDAILALYRGDTRAYGDDHSAADLALVNHLAFWTNYDAARIDRMFRQTGLVRGKWTDRDDYRDRTIAKAFTNLSEPPRGIPDQPLEPNAPTCTWDLDSPGGSL